MLAALVAQAEKHITWAVEAAHGVYERGESILAVVMLRCLRPLGVREASEGTSLCPNMKQVCLFFLPRSTSLPRGCGLLCCQPQMQNLGCECRQRTWVGASLTHGG